MKQRYEYNYVRLADGWFQSTSSACNDYKNIVNEYAGNGWRLLQVFTPPIGVYGKAPWVELIFEREIDSERE